MSVGSGICHLPVVTVSELQWIKAIWKAGINLCHDQPLEALHDDGCRNHWAHYSQECRLDVCYNDYWYRTPEAIREDDIIPPTFYSKQAQNALNSMGRDAMLLAIMFISKTASFVQQFFRMHWNVSLLHVCRSAEGGLNPPILTRVTGAQWQLTTAFLILW